LTDPLAVEDPLPREKNRPDSDTVGPKTDTFRRNSALAFFVNPGGFHGTFPAYIEMQCILNKEVKAAVDRFIGD
jgi:hypothetical protein